MNSRGGYGGEHWSLNERAIPLSHQQIYSSPYYLKCKTTCAALCLCSLIFISNSARYPMSLHEDIQQKMKAAVVQASEQDMNDLPPSWIANQVYDAYGNT